MIATCFASPTGSFEPVYSFLENAKVSIEGAQFQLASEWLFRLLRQKALSGVSIRMLIGEYDIDGPKLVDQRVLIRQLTEIGNDVQILVGPQEKPNQFHSRFLVKDRDDVMVHTFAFTPRGIPIGTKQEERRGNRDFGIIFENNVELRTNLEQLFSSYWKSAPGVAANPETGSSYLPTNPPRGKHFRPRRLEYSSVELLYDKNDRAWFHQKHFGVVEQSRKRLLVYLQYYDLKTAMSQNLLRLMREASTKGVDVRLLVSREAAKALAGAEISFLAPYYGKLHAKLFIADDTVILSTKDWNQNSINNGTDCGVIVRSDSLAQYFTEIFDYDWSRSMI